MIFDFDLNLDLDPDHGMAKVKWQLTNVYLIWGSEFNCFLEKISVPNAKLNKPQIL
jgi:hypothetical protein